MMEVMVVGYWCVSWDTREGHLNGGDVQVVGYWCVSWDTREGHLDGGDVQVVGYWCVSGGGGGGGSAGRVIVMEVMFRSWVIGMLVGRGGGQQERSS